MPVLWERLQAALTEHACPLRRALCDRRSVQGRRELPVLAMR